MELLDTISAYLVVIMQGLGALLLLVLCGVFFNLYKTVKSIAFVADRFRVMADVKSWLNVIKSFGKKRNK